MKDVVEVREYIIEPSTLKLYYKVLSDYEYFNGCGVGPVLQQIDIAIKLLLKLSTNLHIYKDDLESLTRKIVSNFTAMSNRKSRVVMVMEDTVSSLLTWYSTSTASLLIHCLCEHAYGNKSTEVVNFDDNVDAHFDSIVGHYTGLSAEKFYATNNFEMGVSLKPIHLSSAWSEFCCVLIHFRMMLFDSTMSMNYILQSRIYYFQQWVHIWQELHDRLENGNNT